MSHTPKTSIKAPTWGQGHDAPLAYHAMLIRDPLRLDAYDRALRQLVRPGDVVLDIGSGTGLLAMLAARAGAARVHAIESMPVVHLARRMVAVNGLSDVVTVHEADANTLEPVEPVDLVVSEFMGRFVVDDGMLWAVEASRRWLKPTARWCPARVTMKLAPVAIEELAGLDAFEAPVVGLDLSLAADVAERTAYGVMLAREAQLAPECTYAVITPPEVPERFDATMEWTIERGGRLRGLAGWFEADLTDDIQLVTGPGRATHWGQMLFPLPAEQVEAGARLRLRMWRDDSDPDRLVWRWEGDLDGIAIEGATDEALESRGGPDLPAGGGHGGPNSPVDVEELNEAGAEAFEASDFEAAIGWFSAAVCGLRPEHRDLAADYYENLGIALFRAGRVRASIQPLLRALDGRWVGREQSARLLVDAYFRGSLGWEGELALARYEEAFGPHPAGWRRNA